PPPPPATARPGEQPPPLSLSLSTQARPLSHLSPAAHARAHFFSLQFGGTSTTLASVLLDLEASLLIWLDPDASSGLGVR
uniref:Uncharacterized protein n=1 Tax=Oryza brachyantha TaxID=4533 RepID=J3N6A2_ORYBR